MGKQALFTVVLFLAARAAPGFALPAPGPAAQGCYVHVVVEQVEGSDAYATGRVNCLTNSASTSSEQPAELVIHASTPAAAQALLKQNIFVSRADLKTADAMVGEYNLAPSQLGMVGVQEKSGAQSEVTFDHAAGLTLASMSLALGDSASSLVQKVRRGGGFRGGGGRAWRGGGGRWHGGGARWRGGGARWHGGRGYWRGGVWVPAIGYGYSCDPAYEYCGGGYYSNGVWIGGGRGGVWRGGGARWHGGGARWHGGGGRWHGGGGRGHFRGGGRRR